MADEVRFQANQRLDLIDTTRWKQAIQEAVASVMGKILGNPLTFTGAAIDEDYRPAIWCNFRFTTVGAPPTMTIQVDQTYTIGGIDFEALVFDSDGYRLTGPNSVTPKLYTFTNPLIGTRYLIARRVATDASLEGRKHYSSALGEYTANTNTRTYDDWEISESLDEIALNVPASGNVVLRDAGWIDVATFTTIAGPTIDTIVLTPQTNMDDNMNPLTWIAAPPSVDRRMLNIYEWMAGLSQIMQRMRYGIGIGGFRHWYNDPTYDACFEERGGIRFGDGLGGAGLADFFIRLLPASLTQLVVANNDCVDLPGDADDLNHVRAKSFIAGDLAHVAQPHVPDPGPDPANLTGFIYSNDPDGTANPTAVVKYFSLGPWLPKQGLWNGAANSGLWEYPTVGGSVSGDLYWRVFLDDAVVGGSATKALYAKLQVPHLSRIYAVYADIDVITAFPVSNPGVVGNIVCHCRLIQFDRTLGTDTALSDHQYQRADGAPWSTGVWAGSVLAYDQPTDGVLLVDNDLYEYWVSVYLTYNDPITAGNAGYYISVKGGKVMIHIREASHVY